MQANEVMTGALALMDKAYVLTMLYTYANIVLSIMYIFQNIVECENASLIPVPEYSR